MPIEFRDLKRQYYAIKDTIDSQMRSIINATHFISGPQVRELEEQLASYTGRKHCISCANGTDAISIALAAAGIGAGDAVFVPDFTFFSSGECPAAAGAVPVFVDVRADTYNISAPALEAGVRAVIDEGRLKPRAVVAVDLFGQPFAYDAVRAVCEKYGLFLLEDAAQGMGGAYISPNGGKWKAGKLGQISTTSFFPAKPLGCYGDGGAIFTDDDHLADLCRSIAVHGKDTKNPGDPDAKYNNIRLGMNSRLDTLQAGVLLAKLSVFKDAELDAVNHVAEIYAKRLGNVKGLQIPTVMEGCYSSWAQYAVQLPQGCNRAEVQRELKGQGIPTNVYYRKPMHRQGAFKGTRSAVAECPVTEQLCSKVLCLPIHPYLREDEVELVAAKLKDAVQRSVEKGETGERGSSI